MYPIQNSRATRIEFCGRYKIPIKKMIKIFVYDGIFIYPSFCIIQDDFARKMLNPLNRGSAPCHGDIVVEGPPGLKPTSKGIKRTGLVNSKVTDSWEGELATHLPFYTIFT